MGELTNCRCHQAYIRLFSLPSAWASTYPTCRSHPFCFDDRVEENGSSEPRWNAVTGSAMCDKTYSWSCCQKRWTGRRMRSMTFYRGCPQADSKLRVPAARRLKAKPCPLYL